MYGSNYIFSKRFFTGWIVVGILWLFCSAFCVGIWPVVESRSTIVHTVKSMILDVQGKYHPKHHHEGGVIEGESSDEGKGEAKETTEKEATTDANEGKVE